MPTFVRVSFDGVSRSETKCSLNMTVAKGPEREQLAVAISEKTAAALEAILREEPFNSIKSGAYSYEVQETSEGPGLSKTLILIIYKGRARTKRHVDVEKDLFLIIWNIFHLQELPSKITPLRTR